MTCDIEFDDELEFNIIKEKNTLFINRVKSILKDNIQNTLNNSDYEKFESDITTYFYSNKIVFPICYSVRLMISDKHGLQRMIIYLSLKIEEYDLCEKNKDNAKIIAETIINKICCLLIKKSISGLNLAFFN